jgi:site-specific DNA-methyltransferase (adenine-specific)
MLLLNGDCIEEMQKLIDDGVSVDSIVTDPPYHLTSITERFGKEGSAPAQHGTDGAFARASKGFMGKEWDGGDIAFRKETWELAYKLLKPGGHLLAFSGSRTYHRMAVAIEDAGFDIRDQIMWLYGSGFPKSHNIGKAVDAIEKTGKSNPKALRETRMGDDYEPTGQEDYVKGRMFSSDIENDDHEHEVNNDWEGWGTALKPAHEPIVMARKPISEKSIADNVLKHGTGAINIDACRVEGDDTGAERKKVVRKSRSEDGVWTNENSGMKAEGTEFADADPRGRFPANVMHNGLEEDWARYFYCAKTSKSEKGKDNNHPTVKPVELMKYLCRMVTPKGGTVLDIFMGSGSTGMAAKDEGFDFIGIEKDKEYFQIAEQRIKVTAPLSEFMK